MLPPQIGAFYVFVCDGQRSEHFLLLQPQQAEAALALLWSHCQGQIPTGISSRVELHLLPQAGYSYLQLFLPEANYPPPGLQSPSWISSLGQVPPTLSFPEPAGMLLNLSSQHCCGSEQHPGPSGERCQLMPL